jgi:transcriptional regulator with XRE-family HTH domain
MGAIAAARKKAGLTQRDLAVRLDRAHSFVGKIESGERQLNVLEFCELADALKVNPKELFAKIVD